MEAGTAPPAEEPKAAPRSATDYVVLTATSAGAKNWEVLGAYSGLSKRAALTEAAEDVAERLDEDAELPKLVAIPARSWEPVTIAVEKQTRVAIK